MRYLNTRDNNEIVNIKEAIINGLAKDGGLYVPEHIDKIDDIYNIWYREKKNLTEIMKITK